MHRVVVSIIAGIAGLTVIGAAVGSAQTTAPSSAAERRQALEAREMKTKERMQQDDQRLAAAMEARKAKRKSCNQQAKEQNLSFLKRRSFVKDCMAH
ncbi:MAG: hypothetical protein JO205_03540 [Pseudolabrys sp.]|nr:hypothetical protein [Pseudolabrys sp.]MBV9260423.1 hypothetical protein [Pseudolabrys sp.]